MPNLTISLDAPTVRVLEEPLGQRIDGHLGELHDPQFGLEIDARYEALASDGSFTLLLARWQAGDANARRIRVQNIDQLLSTPRDIPPHTTGDPVEVAFATHRRTVRMTRDLTGDGTGQAIRYAPDIHIELTRNGRGHTHQAELYDAGRGTQGALVATAMPVAGMGPFGMYHVDGHALIVQAPPETPSQITARRPRPRKSPQNVWI